MLASLYVVCCQFSEKHSLSSFGHSTPPRNRSCDRLCHVQWCVNTKRFNDIFAKCFYVDTSEEPPHKSVKTFGTYLRAFSKSGRFHDELLLRYLGFAKFYCRLTKPEKMPPDRCDITASPTLLDRRLPPPTAVGATMASGLLLDLWPLRGWAEPTVGTEAVLSRTLFMGVTSTFFSGVDLAALTTRSSSWGFLAWVDSERRPAVVAEEGTGSTVPMVGRRALPLTAGRLMLPGAGPAQLLWFRDEFSLPEKRHRILRFAFLWPCFD